MLFGSRALTNTEKLVLGDSCRQQDLGEMDRKGTMLADYLRLRAINIMLVYSIEMICPRHTMVEKLEDK